jgi:hypothetical protein
MHIAVSAWAGFADLQKDVQRIEAAERRRRRKEFMAALRVATPALLNAAEAIETSWLDLPLDVQSSMVETKRRFDDRIRAGLPIPKDLVERFLRVTMALSLLIYEAEIRNYTFAATRFVGAVSRALADEARQRHAGDELEAADPVTQSAIATGQDEYDRRVGARLSKSEFLSRFSLT